MTHMTTLVLIAILVTIGDAPYCVTKQGRETRCVFYDPDKCEEAARAVDGLCIANITDRAKVPR